MEEEKEGRKPGLGTGTLILALVTIAAEVGRRFLIEDDDDDEDTTLWDKLLKG